MSALVFGTGIESPSASQSRASDDPGGGAFHAGGMPSSAITCAVAIRCSLRFARVQPT